MRFLNCLAVLAFLWSGCSDKEGGKSQTGTRKPQESNVEEKRNDKENVKGRNDKENVESGNDKKNVESGNHKENVESGNDKENGEVEGGEDVVDMEDDAGGEKAVGGDKEPETTQGVEPVNNVATEAVIAEKKQENVVATNDASFEQVAQNIGVVPLQGVLEQVVQLPKLLKNTTQESANVVPVAVIPPVHHWPVTQPVKVDILEEVFFKKYPVEISLNEPVDWITRCPNIHTGRGHMKSWIIREDKSVALVMHIVCQTNGPALPRHAGTLHWPKAKGCFGADSEEWVSAMAKTKSLCSRGTA